MLKVPGVLLTILGLFSVPEDLSHAYGIIRKFLSTDAGRGTFVLLGIGLLLVDKWWSHVPVFCGLISGLRIRLHGLKNLEQLLTKSQAEHFERSKQSDLRRDLEHNMQLSNLCELIAGGYIRAWRFNQVKKTLVPLTPERLSVLRPAILGESSNIYINGAELPGARNDYAYDQRELSQSNT